MTDKIKVIESVKPAAVATNGAGVEVGSQVTIADIRAMEALQEKQKSKSK